MRAHHALPRILKLVKTCSPLLVVISFGLQSLAEFPSLFRHPGITSSCFRGHITKTQRDKGGVMEPVLSFSSGRILAQRNRFERAAFASTIKRVFILDVLECESCGSRMKILTTIHPPDATGNYAIDLRQNVACERQHRRVIRSRHISRSPVRTCPAAVS